MKELRAQERVVNLQSQSLFPVTERQERKGLWKTNHLQNIIPRVKINVVKTRRRNSGERDSGRSSCQSQALLGILKRSLPQHA